MNYFISLKRWRYADNMGWGMLGTLIVESRKDPNSYKCKWLIRNMNRIYRLTRGHGNPWRKFKGI